MAAGILGTGAWLPEQVLTNEELSKRLGVTPDWIQERTGIRERRIAPPGLACSDLAIAAAKDALTAAGTAPDEIGLIIVATSTGDYPSPSTAAIVQAALGVPAALCFDLSAACSGFIYGTVVACGMVDSGQCAKALVIGAEVMSRVVDPTDLNTAILFGDGAGATVIGPLPEGYGLLASDAGSDGSEHAIAFIPAGGSRLPDTGGPGKNGGRFMRMDGTLLFMFAMRKLGDSIVRVMATAGVSPDDIDLIVPHQANRRIIEAAARRIDLPLDRFALNLERYGNTSAASVPLALDEVIRGGRVGTDDLVILAGIGAGLSWGSLLLRWRSPESAPIRDETKGEGS